MNKARLTKKMRHYCQLYQTCTSQAEAYKVAYDVGPNCSPHSIRVQAAKLHSKPQVQEELKRLAKIAEDNARISRGAKVSLALSIAERILREGVTKEGKLLPGSANTALKALEYASKVEGDFTDADNEANETHLDRLRNALKRSQGNE